MVMVTILKTALLLCACPAFAFDCEDGICPVSHLQVQSTVRKTDDDAAELEKQGICKTHISTKELHTPIRQLMAKKPEEDAWCMFGILGPWASACAVARREQNVRNFTELMHQSRAASLHTKKKLQFPDGRMLAIRDREHVQDDLYCYSNGWYNLSRAEVVGDYQSLEEVSSQWCKQLAAELPNYETLSLSDFFKASEAGSTAHLRPSHGPAFVDTVLLQSFKVEAAVKCLLSSGAGGPALCDMAYCARRGCLGVNGEVHYTMLGECQDV